LNYGKRNLIEEALMVHEAEGKAVKGEDPETTSQRPTPQAAKLQR
jgi:hypothetical protein